FGLPKDYTVHEGITTFRGNNYRNDAAYGNASVKEEKYEIIWTNQTSSLGSWSGVGWTGQPLIVRWDDETKKVMNHYEDKNKKKDLYWYDL
ncbi:MAG: pyrrolo-quinoline quinone, partial [Eubacteriales bacterium]|nr:pyrrolo-quinoline quinone [Eubacteriales bacterium]